MATLMCHTAWNKDKAGDDKKKKWKWNTELRIRSFHTTVGGNTTGVSLGGQTWEKKEKQTGNSSRQRKITRGMFHYFYHA